MKPFHRIVRIGLAALLILASGAMAQDGDSPAALKRIVSQIESLFPPVEGTVVAVDGKTLTLDLKLGQPVNKGDRLKLLRYGKAIVHPVTKKKLGREETDLGEVEILDVRRDYSLARILGDSANAEPGDGVQSRFNAIAFLVAPPVIASKNKIDGESLRLAFEEELDHHPRFTVPAFDLKLWLHENGLNTQTLLDARPLELLRTKVAADFILVPNVKTVKGKTALGYALYSATDGALKTKARVLSEELPTASAPPKRPREQEVQSDFTPQKDAPIQYIGKHEFDFEMVDFDIGDLNGDGKKEFIIVDRERVMVYAYKEGAFKRLFQVRTPSKANHILSVDVGDVNHNGRDEIFVTNQVDRKLESFVIEAPPGKNGLRPTWTNENRYFRILRPFGDPPRLITQNPGFTDPFHGPIRELIARNGKYEDGPELNVPHIYGHPFIIYGLTQADLNSDGQKDTIILDSGYRLRVYSPNGRLVVKSNDYYGHDPRLIDVGVKEDVAGLTQQGKAVRFKGRLQLVENGGRYLLIPRNHRLGGSLLKRTVIIDNNSLVVLRLDRDGFEKVFETKKQTGYLAAFQVMDAAKGAGKTVHVASVFREDGFLGKTVSAIHSYAWQGQP
jgi:hypothetical protein